MIVFEFLVCYLFELVSLHDYFSMCLFAGLIVCIIACLFVCLFSLFMFIPYLFVVRISVWHHVSLQVCAV